MSETFWHYMIVLLMVVLCLWLVVIRQWKLLLHWKFRLRMSNPHVHVTFKRLSDNDVWVVYPTTSSIWKTVTLWFLRCNITNIFMYFTFENIAGKVQFSFFKLSFKFFLYKNPIISIFYLFRWKMIQSQQTTRST